MKETIIMDGVILTEFLFVFTIITNLHPLRLDDFFRPFCHSFISKSASIWGFDETLIRWIQ